MFGSCEVCGLLRSSCTCGAYGKEMNTNEKQQWKTMAILVGREVDQQTMSIRKFIENNGISGVSEVMRICAERSNGFDEMEGLIATLAAHGLSQAVLQYSEIKAERDI